MEKIINLTQHVCSAEQAAAGVVEPADKGAVQTALTFVGMPTKVMISERANALAEIATKSGCKKAMIGGPLIL